MTATLTEHAITGRRPVKIDSPMNTGTIKVRDAERTRRILLDEACREFADKGFAGARMDEITRRAKTNKQALYYHFRNKEELFREALEESYRKFRSRDREIDLSQKSPEEGLRQIVAMTFRDIQESPGLVAMVMEENRLKGEHINSEHLRSINQPLLESLSAVLAKGAAQGTLRQGVDAEQFYISLVSLVMFYFSHVHTLSAVLARDLHSSEALDQRLHHITDLLLASLRPHLAAPSAKA